MHVIRHTLIALAVTAALGLAACGSGQDQATTGQPANSGTVAATAGALTAAQVNVQVTLQGTPALTANDQFVAVTVDLANHGNATLTSTGPNPVNLGAHSVDASGAIVENDLARASIPDIAPDSQATITIQFPIDKIMGKSVQILPVQENVAWFDTWGTKALVVGPFNSCANAATGKICDANGKPLPPAAAH